MIRLAGIRILRRVTLLISVFVVGMVAPAIGEDPVDSHRAEVEAFRVRRDAALRAEDGWLSVAGLFWLKPGTTRVGSDPVNDIVLPESAPARLGTLTLSSDGAADFRPEPGVALKLNGAPFPGGTIRSDASGPADVLALDSLRLILIKRGTRHAIRLKDNQSEFRKHFAGLKWYPIDPRWRIEANFVPHSQPTQLVFDTIVGEQDIINSPGYVTFSREGKTYRLDAALESNGKLWFVFRDGTSGRTTHGGARQLTAEPPRDGSVILDFNKACNLPCAYIPYATCPLAPPQNRLSLAITAGEQISKRSDTAK